MRIDVMPNYDFKILQPSEFESLSRDLIQAHCHIFLESFTDGRDRGIDFRYTTTKNKSIIVQVKRYKDFESLYQQLKKEVHKVSKMNPQRYLISTSVGLTPMNKDKIKDLFGGYIKSTEDIIGRDDLNNLLGLYPEVEKKHYKLWLSSTIVLESILQKRIHHWAEFELDKIKTDIHLYVFNESFAVANQILSKYKYVIISGIPGIGKTTLARMLVYDKLANGYDEFYYIPSDIDDAVEVFDENKKQLFFFDDFLGSNIFEPGERKFDQKILSFIEKVQRTKDKYFILTTREYILSDARRFYEKFEQKHIDIAKCTLELQYYTRHIRASILYNHLADINLPNEYVEELLKEKKYMKLIVHPNFNPRIIEAFIMDRIWEKVEPNKFVDKLLNFFDRPFSVWEYSFKHLNKIAQYSLFVLSTMGGTVRLEDWRKAFEYFCKSTRGELNLKCDDLQWHETLRILLDCFIKIHRREGGEIVNFYNPSVKDFISSYMEKYPNVCALIFTNGLYVEQLYSIFCDTPPIVSYILNGYSKIVLGRDLYDSVKEQFYKVRNSKMKCSLDRNGLLTGNVEEYRELNFLKNVISNFPIVCKENPGFIEECMTLDLLLDDSYDLVYRIDFAQNLSNDALDFECSELIDGWRKQIDTTEEYIAFIEYAYKIEDNLVLKDDLLRDQLDDVIQRDIGNMTSIEAIDDLMSKVSQLDYLLLDWDNDYTDLAEEQKNYLESMMEDMDEDSARESYYVNDTNDDGYIDEIFTSLRVKEVCG